MTRPLLKHLPPVLVALACPALLLGFPSMIVLKGVFAGAMFLISALAGESVGRMLPKPAAVGLAVISIAAIATAVALGWVEAGGSTPGHFGDLALIVIALATPIRALVIQRWPEKAVTKH